MARFNVRRGTRYGTNANRIGVIGLAVGFGLLVSAQHTQAVPFAVFSTKEHGELASSSIQERARGTELPRDYLYQLVHEVADKIAVNYPTGGDWGIEVGKKYSPSTPWQSSVHPLSRGIGYEVEKDDASLKKRQVPPFNLLPSVVGRGNAEEAEETTTHSSPSISAAREPTASASPSDSSSSGQVSQSTDKIDSASSPLPTIASTASNSSPSSVTKSNDPSLTDTSSSRDKPTPTDNGILPLSKEDGEKGKDKDREAPSIISPKHKLFPLTITGIAAGGILVFLAFIAIARTIAHHSMRRDEARKANGSYHNKGKTDRLTSATPGMSAARSIRRAITKKKLGSFARRQQTGSVLIDVGDEVFAVPAHLAENYRQEMIRERKASKESITDGPFGRIRPRYLTGGGSDVEGWRAKLAYNEQANGNTKASRTLSQRLADRLRFLTQSSVEEERDDPDYDWEKSKQAFSFDSSSQAKGAIRQSDLCAQMPVLTHGSSDWTIRKSVTDRDSDDPRNRDIKPKATPSRKLVAYRGINPTDITANASFLNKPNSQKPESFHPTHSREYLGADASALSHRLIDLEKQTSFQQDHRRRSDKRFSQLPPTSELSHERITLTDDPSQSSSSIGRDAGIGAYLGSRLDLNKSTGKDSASPKSVEVGRVEVKHAQRAGSVRPVASTYRHRKVQHPAQQAVSTSRKVESTYADGYPRTSHPKTHTQRYPNSQGVKADRHTPTTSTKVASSALYQNRAAESPVQLRPEKPASAVVKETTSTGFRPLPLPPHLSPFIP